MDFEGGRVMSKLFTLIASWFFLIAAAVHGYRAIAHPFTVVIAGYDIPVWVSLPIGAAALLLGVMLMVEARR